MHRLARLLGIDGLDRRASVVIPAAAFVYSAGLSSTATFLTAFLVLDRGLPAPLVGLALLVQSLIRAVVGPVVGALSDRHGRRTPMVVGLVTSALGAPTFLLVGDPLSLFVWAILVGAVRGSFTPISFALILDLVPPARQRGLLALNLATQNIGYVAATVAVGALVGVGWGHVAAFSTFLFVAAAVIIVAFLRGPLPHEGGGGASIGRTIAASVSAFGDRAFLALAGLGFAFPFGLGVLISVLPLYAIEGGLPPTSVGLILSLNGVVVALGTVPVNARLAYGDPFRQLAAAAAITALATLFLRSEAIPMMAAAIVGYAVAEIVFATALVAAVASLTPPGARGAYQGAWQFVQAAGFGSALALTGLARDLVGWEATWTLVAAAMGAAAVAFLALTPRFLRIVAARESRRHDAAAVV